MAVLCWGASCAPGAETALIGDGEDDTGKADVVYKYLGYKSVSSAAHFKGLSFAGGVALQGPSVKFLIDNRKPQTPVVYFQNARFKQGGQTPPSARYHYYFAQAVLSSFAESGQSFNQTTYYAQAKRYVAGTIQAYQLKPGAAPLYGIQLYPEDVAAEATLLHVVKAVKKVFKVAGAKVAFVATGPQQTTATIGASLTALGVEATSVDKILGAVSYLPMNLGEAWGYLRIFPASPDQLTPLDIAVYEELPLDLAVVAGVITKAFQDASCHVNLKSKERGTPDMVLRDAGPQQAQLAPFDGKPVHLVVGLEGFKIEATTAEVVAQKFKERTNKPWVPLLYEPTDEIKEYSALCPASAAECITRAKRYGSKAANLGLLTSAKVLGRVGDAGSVSQQLGYDLVPDGVAVPIKLYHDFVALPGNASLRTKLKALIDAEKAQTLSPAQRVVLIKDLQQAFYAAPFPAALLQPLQAKLQAALPGVVKLKLRSSANAEDLPGFDGAGLYDSFAANLSKTDNADGSCQIEGGDDVETKLEVKPKTLACALKAVFASTWNRRAVEERSFARLDHATAGMGVAIVPKYDTESPIAANAVVVTRVIGNDGIYGYSFSTQQGNNLVTNPMPGTSAENIIAAFTEENIPPTFTVTRYAIPVAAQPAVTHTVLSTAQMQTLLKVSRAVENGYCAAKPGYHPGGCQTVTLDPAKPTALDLEFKLLENGRLVCKQLREFAGR